MIRIKASSLDKVFKISILAALFLISVFLARNILFPIIFALFFSFALLGPARWLESKGFSRFLSSLLLILLSTGIVLVGLFFVFFQGYELVNDLDLAASTRRLGFLEDLGNWLKEHTMLEVEDKQKAYNYMTKQTMASSGAAIKSAIGTIQTALVFLSLVPVYALLFLTYRGRFRKFLEKFFKRSNSDAGVQMVEQIASMMQSYLSGLLVVILIVAVLYTGGLALIGIKYAILLGIITALLIILPYIGAVIGAILPAGVALLTMDQWWYALIVLGLYVAVQLLEGYVLTPLIVGKNVDLNPLTIILGMVVLGALGGMLALIIAVPLLASVKIVLSHFEQYDSFSLLMGQESTSENA